MIGPFWRYYGGKHRAAPRYPAPTHRIIVEPFAGAAGYSCRYPSHDVVLIEIDPRIAAIWRWLIGATYEEIVSVPDVPDGGTVDDIDAPKAARDLVGFWCNGGASQPSKTPSKWAREYPGKCGWARYRNRVAIDAQRIKHWRIIEGSYADAPDLEASWFVDPPYQSPAGRHYRHDSIDYDHLGQWCDDRRGQVIACDQAGSTWRQWTHSVPVKSTTHERGFGRISREVFWTNAPPISLFEEEVCHVDHT